jgi:hypothetical protein
MDKNITLKQNTNQHGGNPPRESYDFPINKRNKFMDENPICQLCKINKSVECAHIYSGDPKGPRYNPRCTLKMVTSKKNMLALCKKCHDKIDNKNNILQFGADKLKELKN